MMEVEVIVRVVVKERKKKMEGEGKMTVISE